MCGIAGFSLSPSDNLSVNSKKLARSLLLGIEHRGPDATGFAYLDRTGTFQIHKQDVTAADFVRRGLCLDKRARTAILHTRNWTTGHPSNNLNNHPLPQGSIVGVHNGWLTNHNELWGEAVRADRQLAEVDSEVIFAMLAHGHQDSGCTVIQALEAAKANLAVAWIDSETPSNLYLARGHGSPLWVGQSKAGSLIFASEKDVVAKAAAQARIELTHLREIEEGNLITVDSGEVLNIQGFKPQGPGYTSSRRYSNAYSWEDDYDYGTPFGGRPAGAVTVVKSARQAAEVFADAEAIEGRDEEQVNLEWIDRTLFDPSVLAPASDTPEAYYEAYCGRENAVDKWFSDFRGGNDSMMESCSRMKALVRPGQEVTTRLGDETYNAQVLLCPNTFPTGKFVLRVFVPRRVGDSVLRDTEAVLVERHYWQFDEKEVPAPAGILTIEGTEVV